MKKLFALLLLLLALGSAAAGAEQGTRVRLLISMPPDSELRSDRRVGGLDGSWIELSLLPDGIDLSLANEEASVCLLRAVRDETGAMLRSDLVPSFAIHARALPKDAQAETLSPLQRRRNAQSEAQVQYIMDLSRPYVREIAGFIEQVQKQTEFSEDYSVMTIELTADLLNALLDTLADSLRADTALADALNDLLQRAKLLLPDTRQLSADAIQSALADGLRGLRIPGNQAYATLRTRNDQNGAGLLEISTMKDTVITYEAAPDGNALAARFGEALLLSGNIETDAADLPALTIPDGSKIIELNNINAVDIQRLMLDAQRNGILAAPET